jgi:hypothetical protein
MEHLALKNKAVFSNMSFNGNSPIITLGMCLSFMSAIKEILILWINTSAFYSLIEGSYQVVERCAYCYCVPCLAVNLAAYFLLRDLYPSMINPSSTWDGIAALPPDALTGCLRCRPNPQWSAITSGFGDTRVPRD